MTTDTPGTFKRVQDLLDHMMATAVKTVAHDNDQGVKVDAEITTESGTRYVSISISPIVPTGAKRVDDA